MPNLRQFNWGRIAIALILLLVIGGIVFAVVRSATGSTSQNKPVTIDSAKDSAEDKSNDPQKAQPPTTPKPATPPTTNSTPAAPKPSAAPSATPDAQNLATTGPSANALALFVGTSIIGIVAHNRFLRASVTNKRYK